MASSSREHRVHPEFSSPDSDLSLVSSDGVLFRTRRRQLEMFSEVFADAGACTSVGRISAPPSPPPSPRSSSHMPVTSPAPEDVVPLSETSEVLELLLQYTALGPQPTLSALPFETMYALAEAVEKYIVYCARDVCAEGMRKWVNERPMEVMMFARRHQHHKLFEDAARTSMEKCLTVDAVYGIVTGDVFGLWIKYYQAHASLLAAELSRYSPKRFHARPSTAGRHPSNSAYSSSGSPGSTTSSLFCASWTRTYAEIVSTLVHPGALYKLPKELEKRSWMLEGSGECEICLRDVRVWGEKVEKALDEVKVVG